MNELPENMRGSDLKKLLNESSNPHLPNLLNIAKRYGAVYMLCMPMHILYMCHVNYMHKPVMPTQLPRYLIPHDQSSCVF